MTIMKQAWAITRQDFRNNPYSLLWTLLFIMYLGVTISVVVSIQLGESGALNPVADFVMLVLTPFLGFITVVHLNICRKTPIHICWLSSAYCPSR
jgi:uncharacterized BrkB/YihY/UPF0761 family membrane protein